MTDLVWIVKPGDGNEELRWSLRSAVAHVPHENVWIVGSRPGWCTAPLIEVPKPPGTTKWAQSTSNVRAACEHPDVADDFVLFNDDFFVMSPLEEVPLLDRGPVSDVLEDYLRRRGASPYVKGMARTAEVVRQHLGREPLSFELHVPMPVHGPTMLAALELGARAGIEVLHKRSLYGNLVIEGGRPSTSMRRDPKVCEAHPDWSPTWPFLSTDDRSFDWHAVGRHIRQSFPERSPYEG